MPLSAFALILLAGFIHASWNIAAKKANGDARFALQSGVFMMGVWAPVGIGLGWNDLTVVYPLARGSGPLLSSLVAILFLGEQISALGLAGIAGVVLGVFLVAGGPALWRSTHDAARRERLHKGIRYGALTGAFIAGYTVVDSYAVKVLAMSPILVDYFGNVVRVGLLAPAALRDRAAAARLWRAQDRVLRLAGATFIAAGVIALALG